MIRTCLLSLAFCLLSLNSFSQGFHLQYLQYKIEFDSLENHYFVQDTLNQKRFMVDYPYTHYPGKVQFREGFVYVRTGDMKGLMSLQGEKLLEPCHFINFNSKDSLISAYICNGHSWAFLDYNGKLLNKAPAGRSNYCPRLTEEINPAHVYDKDSKGLLWGYLDKGAQWVIPPKFEEAENFVWGEAKVKQDGKWGKINEQGEWVVQPTFDSSDLKNISD